MLYVTTRVTNKFKRYLYLQCSNVFIQVRNICFTGSLCMGGRTIFKVGEQVHVKKFKTFLWFDLATVTPQALKYDVINFCQHVYPFQSRVRHFSCRALQSYKSPGDWARELFKPSTDSASLVAKIKKKIFVLGLSFSGLNVTSRGVFALFWPSLPGPGRRPNGPFFGLKV